MDIDEVVARVEIEELLYRYARGVDRSDLHLLQSVYHDDAMDHHGPYRASGAAFAQRLVDREHAVEAVGEHHITNINMKIAGDDAWVESYFLAFHPHSDDGDEPTSVDPAVGARYLGIGAGRFLDHMQRRNGDWKILHREVVLDWSRRDLPGEVWPRGSWQVGGFTQGKRHDDRSYVLFGEETAGCSWSVDD